MSPETAQTGMDAEAVRAEGRRLRALFAAQGAAVVRPDILQPADTLLDIYGEDIRARAYVTSDPLRGEMMLRPDFTVPIVQTHMAATRDTAAEPARYAYAGKVFRKQEVEAARPIEYVQAGYEVFDGQDPARADAEVFAVIAQGLEGQGIAGLRAVTGDLGVLTAAIAGLSTTAPRKAALMRHIWRPKRFRALLERFAGRVPPPAGRVALLAEDDPFAGCGPEFGRRSRAEIAERLDRLREDMTAAPIPQAEIALIDRLLALKAPLPEALAVLGAAAAEMPALGASVARAQARVEALAVRGIDVATLQFEAAYGRTTMEYYDGFVFGFVADATGTTPIATGGRYDALTRVLGEGRAVPAVGAVIRPALSLLAAGGAA